MRRLRTEQRTSLCQEVSRVSELAVQVPNHRRVVYLAEITKNTPLQSILYVKALLRKAQRYIRHTLFWQTLAGVCRELVRGAL